MWKRTKRIGLWLAWMSSIAGCSTLPASNQYFCPPQLAYTEAGQLDPAHYRVEVACYQSMTAKQKACYLEAR